MNCVVFDNPVRRAALLPFTYTRPVAGLRVGILTLHQKWEKHLQQTCSWLTEPHLAALFPFAGNDDTCFVDGALCADPALAAAVAGLLPNQVLRAADGQLLAARTQRAGLAACLAGRPAPLQTVRYTGDFTRIDHPWHIFKHNAAQITADFALLTAGRTSAPLTDPHTVVYGRDRLFLEPGATVRAAVLNASAGPIYLGPDAFVQEGSLLQGPVALCRAAGTNLGAKVRGGTTVGPWCKVGGEVSNVVLMGHSNKAHDGFLGNAVLGEWCNLGAGSSGSNLKNTYGPVRMWSHATETFEDTGEMFCGLMMGDHAKAGINTMFNTGTVVGVGANVFGSGFPPKFVPSFAWGATEASQPFASYDWEQFQLTTRRTMARRELDFDPAYASMLRAVYEQTAHHRSA